MKRKNKITKAEKQGIVFIIAGIVVFAFLTDPITTFVNNIFSNTFFRFIVGVLIVIVIAWVGKLNEIFK
ncbi:MAG TPA: hypothetical protein VGB37_14545 [Candidatus Lokiarchaeia archaeon]